MLLLAYGGAVHSDLAGSMPEFIAGEGSLGFRIFALLLKSLFRTISWIYLGAAGYLLTQYIVL